MDKDKEKETKRRYNQTPKGRSVQAKSRKATRKKFPERVRAYSALARAIRSKKIIRPSVCEVIGCHINEGIEGHHHDYNKPLDITWLCMTHHKQIHQGH